MFCLAENLPFPEHYQQSVILGCVEVTDCLSQEQYRERVSKHHILADEVCDYGSFLRWHVEFAELTVGC